MYSTHLHAQQLILMLIEKGITDIVISPGSRNAPLTLSFARNEAFTCYSIVDERCAAHVALGMAQQLKKPVAVVCTSGSALLNYYPAVAEAFYSEIPLLVLSADRPPHKIDIADGQTIRQRNVFSNHIMAQTQLQIVENATNESEITYNNKEINQVLNSFKLESGPVHINIPFEEPLYDLVPEASIAITSTDALVPEVSVKSDAFIKDWVTSKKIMVIIATQDKDTLTAAAIKKLLHNSSVLLLSEVSGNVVHSGIIWSIDTLIAPIEQNPELYQQLFPEVVITIGGMMVSKKIKQLLRKAPDLSHYHLGENKASDTFFALKQHIKSPPADFLEQLPDRNSESSYRDFWNARFDKIVGLRKTYFENMPWSDFKAFELIFNKLPDNLQLQLGNSSTIRYAQLFAMNATHRIYSNRGTSGIDGSTSTAIGAAIKSAEPCWFITGDISFLYDSNALWNNYIPANFKIIVINNAGGGIFRILPGHENRPEYDTFFETQHNLDATHLCKMFDLGYHRVDGEHAFAKAYTSFESQNDKPQVLEIFTPNKVNEKILLDYFKFLR
jgi:2-succinyl-5-enolpyruvyl-6-hydroxy-3-cyclohexene-1-carboxylate synthase